MKNINIVDVTVDNVAEVGVCCIKNKKSSGYKAKIDWFKLKINDGLLIKIALDKQGKELGFVEYMPSEIAWRPILVDNYYYVQCIAIYVKDARKSGLASHLLEQIELEAKRAGKSGLCAMSSDGVWMANKTLFEKNGYAMAEKLDRFELMYKPLQKNKPIPKFNNWNFQLDKYKGWNLVYADQCPWHNKSVYDLEQAASDYGIALNITKLKTPQEAQCAPSGFGTFSLINNGKLLADHYISRTRFENILKKEEV